MTSSLLQDQFRQPPPVYGPVPFYWWAGEALDRDRVAWQLDQLCRQGVRRTVVSYPHLPDGTCDLGDPPLFSQEWWDFFRWFLGACRERGMTAGFQDYNLMAPVLTQIGRETPGMQGGQLSCAAVRASAGESVRLMVEQDCHAISAWAYPVREGVPDPARALDLSTGIDDGELVWNVPSGEWLVALVLVKPAPFDPMHPEGGRKVIERYFAPFEQECGAELGVTLDLFFQDELDFGGRMPFWSGELLASFKQRAGYDAARWLPALWHDLGPVTEKFRLDYADVVAGSIAERFFEPLFRWNEERGILFGHDNCGRGRIAEGRAHYGDYFRTMRWFSAPGSDDPKLDGARAFKGLKVSSSIAHLYRRPRVWVEAFHSSGWGTTPERIVAAINEDFAYGATVVNLHGLYYSTRGGWWEWAPPDFHFRQPYWQHAGALNDYFTRVSWLLSQGVHRCDVAIIYPIASLEAEPADPVFPEVVAHVDNEPVSYRESGTPEPEETAFALGKYLFDHACDFDLIDFESLAGAGTKNGRLTVADASYAVLIFPAMRTVRWSMIEKAREFVRAGGLVIAFGCLPTASEKSGRDDAELGALVEEIFGSSDDSESRSKRHAGGGVGVFFRRGYSDVLDAVAGAIDRDVSTRAPLHVLHRHLGDRDAYFVFNPSEEMVTADIRFRCVGGMERWDAWSGKAIPVSSSNIVEITLAPREALIFVSNPEGVDPVACAPKTSIVQKMQVLEAPWESQIHPVLDNRFGDFSVPAMPGLLGPQARRFRYLDEVVDGDDWVFPDYDDSAWPETTFSFGPQLEVSGPFPPDTDFRPIEKSFLNGGKAGEWRPYVVSRRWGIERDPFLTDWLSGPHGLKGAVPDEFLDFHSETPGSVWYLRAKVVVEEAGQHTLVTGARCGYQVWLNGKTAVVQQEGLCPGRYPPWNIPHYESEKLATGVDLQKGSNDLLVKLVQPVNQRTRAYVAFDPPQSDPEQPALRWFTADGLPRPCVIAGPGRRAIRFRFMSPPGLLAIDFVARGNARIWVGGKELAATPTSSLVGGCTRYRGSMESAGAEPQVVAIRVEAPADSHAGDALPEPVAFTCGSGVIHTGDWCEQGLATYSGAVEYKRTVFMPPIIPGRCVQLDLGSLSATAQVWVNGNKVATMVTPPWRCDVTPYLVPGRNTLSIFVANTLANHYSVGIPSPYVFRNQTPSGLFGPVTLVTNS